jgi:hypothetical protein
VIQIMMGRPLRRQLPTGHIPGELPGGIDVGGIRVAAADEQALLTFAEIAPYDLGTLCFHGRLHALYFVARASPGRPEQGDPSRPEVVGLDKLHYMLSGLAAVAARAEEHDAVGRSEGSGLDIHRRNAQLPRNRVRHLFGVATSRVVDYLVHDVSVMVNGKKSLPS